MSTADSAYMAAPMATCAACLMREGRRCSRRHSTERSASSSKAMQRRLPFHGSNTMPVSPRAYISTKNTPWALQRLYVNVVMM